MLCQRLSLRFPDVLAILAAAILTTSALVAAQTATVLHTFSRSGGDYPIGGLAIDAAGNLYGMTAQGGAHKRGTVFEISPDGNGGWTEKTLYSFGAYELDGFYPQGNLTLDAAGNLYGTTLLGGAQANRETLNSPAGTVFRLSPNPDGSWSEKILYSFGAYLDGAGPTGSLVFDAWGHIFGATFLGGTGEKCNGGGGGCGTLFELAPNGHGGWVERILYSFNVTSTADGGYPQTGLVSDAAGNLYGVTWFGGGAGSGTVFELRRNSGGGWSERVLHSFDSADAAGSVPSGG